MIKTIKMDALTREQKEYIKLKAAFERMCKNLEAFRRIDGNQCTPKLSKQTEPDAEYTVETYFKNLLDNYDNSQN